MEDNSGKLNVVIGLLVMVLLFMASVWILPNINIVREVTCETTAVTVDRVEITVNWTAKYKSPLIFPREERVRAEGKIELYGSARVHALGWSHISVVLYNMKPEELQKEFDSLDAIREIIRAFDNKIDNVKSIKLNSITFETDSIKQTEKVDINQLTTMR